MSKATNTSIAIALVFAIVFCCCHNFAQARPNHDAAAETRHFKSELKDDGSYKYQFETSNGIAASESGVGGYHASGHSAYYAPDGKLIQLSYTADEHGFHPTGEHLPTPPPVPEAILKSLEYIRAHPHEDEYKGASGQAHSSYHGNKKF
ncbi:pupal cuticle protein Edg-78E-like [Anastrepha obliqua]|uniref:pupal cuticle protein Edg-78E-like n=1 Tax=Anastrepha obliqua TaxID=95512 RepID=UPI0024090566|nr:pupal cuticle protein Edg-78E-like [Anastrepha obliqua]